PGRSRPRGRVCYAETTIPTLRAAREHLHRRTTRPRDDHRVFDTRGDQLLSLAQRHDAVAAAVDLSDPQSELRPRLRPGRAEYVHVAVRGVVVAARDRLSDGSLATTVFARRRHGLLAGRIAAARLGGKLPGPAARGRIGRQRLGGAASGVVARRADGGRL